MTEWAALMATVAADPADDLARLVAADWLEDRGRADLAAFIRTQIELEPNRGLVELPGVAALHERERELVACEQEQSAPLAEVFRKRPGEAEVRVRRGFPDRLSVTAAAILSRGPEAFRASATVRRLRVFRVNGFAARLVKSDCLRGWPDLELAGWYTLAEAEILANGRPLPDVEVLTVWAGGTGYHEVADDFDLVRVLAAGRAWPNLRTLELFGPAVPFARPGQLGRVADAAAGRPVARTDATDARLPFPPDFPHFCPGVRPNNKILVAKPAGDSIHVIRFSHRGAALPPEIVPHTPAVRAAVAATVGPPLESPAVRAAVLGAVGAAPAFVRLHPFRWPDREGEPVPGRVFDAARWGAACHVPDPPRGPLPAFGHEFGYGGEIARLVEANEFGCDGRRYDGLGRAVG